MSGRKLLDPTTYLLAHLLCLSHFRFATVRMRRLYDASVQRQISTQILKSKSCLPEVTILSFKSFLGFQVYEVRTVQPYCWIYFLFYKSAMS